MYKKITVAGMALTIALTASIQVMSAENTTLSDISGHWSHRAVTSAIQKGYVDGYPDGSFKPDNSVTRAEFMKMLTTAQKLNTKETATGEWFEKYIQTLAEQKIYSQGDFDSPDFDKAISRLEMAKLAVRSTMEEFRQEGTIVNNESFAFKAVKSGLIQGLSGGELGLSGPTTRAQATTIIERLLAIKDGKKLDVDQKALGYAELELRGTNMETVWGIQSISLPYKHPEEIYDGVTLTVEQIRVIDMSDKDAPFYDEFVDGDLRSYANGVNRELEDLYVLSFKLKFDVDRPLGLGEKGMPNFLFPNYGSILKKNSQDRIITLDTDKVGAQTGTYDVVMPKQTLQTIKNNGETVRFTLQIGNKRVNFVGPNGGNK